MSANGMCWTALTFFSLTLIHTLGVALPNAQAAADNLIPRSYQSVNAGTLIAASQEAGPPDPRTKPTGPADSGSEALDSPSAIKGTPDDIQAFKERIIESQNKGRLGFRKVVLCSSVEGFGIYSPPQPGQAASRILLYFEPSNFSTLVSEGRYIVDLAVDLSIFDAAGKLIGGKEGVLKINRVSRSPVIDLYYKMDINLKKPLKQHIVVTTTLHDRIKNQSVSASYKVNVHSATNKMLDQI